MKNKLFHWLAANKVLLEVLLVSLSAATYFLIRHQVIKDQGLFMFFMTTLATFYFLSAYLPMELKGLLEIIAMKVVGISSAVSIIGLQFHLLGLTGGGQMMVIGGTSLGFAGVILLISWIQSRNIILVPLLLRIAILSPIVLFVFSGQT